MHSCCTRGYNRCRSENGTGTRKHEYGRILVAKHSHPTTVGRTQQSTASKKWQAPCAFNTKLSVCLMNARSKAPKLFTQCGPHSKAARQECSRETMSETSNQASIGSGPRKANVLQAGSRFVITWTSCTMIAPKSTTEQKIRLVEIRMIWLFGKDGVGRGGKMACQTIRRFFL